MKTIMKWITYVLFNYAPSQEIFKLYVRPLLVLKTTKNRVTQLYKRG